MPNKCVIDLGSNTIKLYIAEISENGLVKPILSKRRMTSLGKNVNKTGKLAEEGKKLALEYIQEYLNICEKHNINTTNIFVTGTAACRNAFDGKKFFNEIETKFQLKNNKILSGIEEANFTFLGVLENINTTDNNLYSVIDIGGGSFQISIGSNNKFLCGTSIQKGCNSVTEEFELDKIVDEEYIKKVISYFKKLNIYGLTFPADSFKVIGVGGTIKIMQLMTKKESEEPIITTQELLNTAIMLANKSIEQRYEWFKSKFPSKTQRVDYGLTEKRAKVFLAGLCITIGLLEKLSAKEVFISETDAKDYIIKLDKL